jgi:hypothetical protein
LEASGRYSVLELARLQKRLEDKQHSLTARSAAQPSPRTDPAAQPSSRTDPTVQPFSRTDPLPSHATRTDPTLKPAAPRSAGPPLGRLLPAGPPRLMFGSRPGGSSSRGVANAKNLSAVGGGGRTPTAQRAANAKILSAVGGGRTPTARRLANGKPRAEGGIKTPPTPQGLASSAKILPAGGGTLSPQRVATSAKTLPANGGTPSPKPVAVKPEDMEKTVAALAAATSKPIKTKTNELGTVQQQILILK